MNIPWFGDFTCQVRIQGISSKCAEFSGVKFQLTFLSNYSSKNLANLSKFSIEFKIGLP